MHSIKSHRKTFSWQVNKLGNIFISNNKTWGTAPGLNNSSSSFEYQELWISFCCNFYGVPITHGSLSHDHQVFTTAPSLSTVQMWQNSVGKRSVSFLKNNKSFTQSPTANFLHFRSQDFLMFPSMNLPVKKGNGISMVHLGKSTSIAELQWKIRTQPARKEESRLGW